MGGTSGQFKRQTDLKRSSGLRLSTPVRSLVERVAESAGLTYSDAIRLLVEEALAARAGRQDHLAAKLAEIETRLGDIEGATAEMHVWLKPPDREYRY